MSNAPNPMAQLSAMVASGQFGTIPGQFGSMAGPQPVPFQPIMQLTQEQVSAMIDERLKAYTAQVQQQAPAAQPAMTKLASVIAQAEGVFQRALPPADYKAFQEYTQSGGKGFDEILKSEALYPIVQLLWETIKENTK